MSLLLATITVLVHEEYTLNIRRTKPKGDSEPITQGLSSADHMTAFHPSGPESSQATAVEKTGTGSKLQG